MGTSNVKLSEISSVMQEVLQNGGEIIFTSSGTSMMPMLRDRKDRVVLVKPSGRLKKYDIPLYVRKNGQYVLHRIIGKNRSGYIICGDNQYVKEYGVDDNQIIGVLKGWYVDEEYHSFSDKKYKNYCRTLFIRRSLKHTKSCILRIKNKIIRNKHQ